MAKRLLIFLLFACGTAARAEELIWGFGPLDGMPYVAVDRQQLAGGFIKLLGDRVGQRLGVTVRFVETPNNRQENFLADGRIQLICNANPQWLGKTLPLHWSAPLYEEEDVLLQHERQAPLIDLAALRGKTLGTSLGFVYSPPLMTAFADGSVHRKDVRDLETRLHMLTLQRLDAIIDMRRPLAYRLERESDPPLRLSPWVVERYSMHCAYGPHLPLDPARLDEVLLTMRDSGEIAALMREAQR